MPGLRYLTFILLATVLDIIASEVTLVRRQSYASSACNSNITYDRVLLKHVTLLSKYIFTGKVFSVNNANGTRVYRVNIRRVLKGDLDDIGVVVKFGAAKSMRFSDATVFVERSSVVECPLRVRTYGIFLTEKRRGGGMLWLSLVVEPLVLTLRSIGVIEAAIKGTI